jgi:hypothetical protein
VGKAAECGRMMASIAKANGGKLQIRVILG